MTIVSRTAILTLLGICFSTSALRAQSIEAELKSRLNNKPLYLRGCWNIDNLHFDSTGKLISNAGQITITLCGFETRSVHLKNDKLVIDGYRVGLELANDKIKRVKLSVVTHPGAQDDEEMRLEIDAPPNGDYSQALDAILVDGLEGMVPALPGYWRRYAQKYFLQTTPTPPPVASQPQQLKHVGGQVKAPVLIDAKEPSFNSSARALKYGGNVLVNLWVEQDGSPSHLSIVRAVGLGLDESALAAIQKYRFKPAMQDSKPVLVELNVSVNFNIF
jgi:TonB family protein